MITESFNLNIKFDFPIWEYRMLLIYAKMEGWIKGSNYWFSRNTDEKHVVASLEPSGLQFSAKMAAEELKVWKDQFKKSATEILGYKIGELELGEVGDLEWIDPSMKVLESFRDLHLQCLLYNDSSAAGRFYDLDKSNLTELDELEQMKILFKLKGHSLHDQLASDFQKRRHPSTTSFLYEMVLNGSIPEEDYKPISRKCIWALADIGTEHCKKLLVKLSKSENAMVNSYAKKRLKQWDIEKKRKGRYMLNNFRKGMKLEKYKKVESILPTTGKHVIGYQSEDEIVVYQAYKPAIAEYAVAHQQLGGSSFSYNRMSWIKPGFLWMMFRSGWAEKENQERILAIHIKKSDLETILSEAVLSSFNPDIYSSQEEWKERLQHSEVRVQWDPDHDPYGNKKERKAIQIGLKGDILNRFGHEMIQMIEDITPFVQKQHLYVKDGQLDQLEIPHESVYDSPAAQLLM